MKNKTPCNCEKGTDCSEVADPKQPETREAEAWFVFWSPADSHCAVMHWQDGVAAGWQKRYGPAIYVDCWTWIHANCRGGPNYFFC